MFAVHQEAFAILLRVGAGLGAAATIAAVLRAGYRVARKLDSIIETVTSIQREFQEDHGSSMRDQVTAARSASEAAAERAELAVQIAERAEEYAHDRWRRVANVLTILQGRAELPYPDEPATLEHLDPRAGAAGG